MQRRTTREGAKRLREWFLRYMQDDAYEMATHRSSRAEGFVIGPSQLMSRANMNQATGSRWLGDGANFDEEYVPFAEYLRDLTLALRGMLENLGHPNAAQVTVLRAFLEAGYLEEQDIVDFLEAEGVKGWMKEKDCIGEGQGLDLRKLDGESQLLVREFYNFRFLAKEASEDN